MIYLFWLYIGFSSGVPNRSAKSGNELTMDNSAESGGAISNGRFSVYLSADAIEGYKKLLFVGLITTVESLSIIQGTGPCWPPHTTTTARESVILIGK